MKVKIVQIEDKFYVRKGWLFKEYLHNQYNCWSFQNNNDFISEYSFNTIDAAERHYSKYLLNLARNTPMEKEKVVKVLK
jgi:hypothetical protein